MEYPKQILLVDDDPKVARWIQLELERNHYACAVEHTGGRAIDRLTQDYFDLVITDIVLPDMSGILLCECIREFSNVPILALSALDDCDTKVQAITKGANDYVTKPFSFRELLARINAMVRTMYNPLRTEKVLRLQDIVLYEDRHEVVVGTRRVLFPKMEFLMLAFMMRNKNIVLSRDTIFERVWGAQYLGNTNLIDVYAKAIRRKLDASQTGRFKYIRTVRGVGYVAYE